jgi:hypothetical protein
VAPNLHANVVHETRAATPPPDPNSTTVCALPPRQGVLPGSSHITAGAAQDTVQPQRTLGRKGRLALGIRSAGGGGQPAGRAAYRRHACEGTPLGSRRQRGGSRAGDRLQPRRPQHQGPRHHRPIRPAARLASDARPGGGLSRSGAPAGRPARALHRPRRPCLRYQSRPRPHREPESRPDIPPKRTRLWKSCFSKTLYKGRKLHRADVLPAQGLPPTASRYDRLAINFLGNIHLAATIMWWS